MAHELRTSDLLTEAVAAYKHIEKGTVQAGEIFARSSIHKPQLRQNELQVHMNHDVVPDEVRDDDRLIDTCDTLAVVERRLSGLRNRLELLAEA